MAGCFSYCDQLCHGINLKPSLNMWRYIASLSVYEIISSHKRAIEWHGKFAHSNFPKPLSNFAKKQAM